MQMQMTPQGQGSASVMAAWAELDASDPVEPMESVELLGPMEPIGHREHIEQLAFIWELPVAYLSARSTESDESERNRSAVAHLPALTRQERLELEYGLMGLSSGPHPLAFYRRAASAEVQPIAVLAELPEGAVVRLAVWVVSAQRPPTAKGMGFLVIEDETERLPVALPPRLTQDLHQTIHQAHVVVVSGRVERVRWYRSLLAVDLHPLQR